MSEITVSHHSAPCYAELKGAFTGDRYSDLPMLKRELRTYCPNLVLGEHTGFLSESKWRMKVVEDSVVTAILKTFRGLCKNFVRRSQTFCLPGPQGRHKKNVETVQFEASKHGFTRSRVKDILSLL